VTSCGAELAILLWWALFSTGAAAVVTILSMTISASHPKRPASAS
jgi:hypothetical protein